MQFLADVTRFMTDCYIQVEARIKTEFIVWYAGHRLTDSLPIQFSTQDGTLSPSTFKSVQHPTEYHMSMSHQRAENDVEFNIKSE